MISFLIGILSFCITFVGSVGCTLIGLFLLMKAGNLLQRVYFKLWKGR
jgi:hypothetical protein